MPRYRRRCWRAVLSFAAKHKSTSTASTSILRLSCPLCSPLHMAVDRTVTLLPSQSIYPHFVFIYFCSYLAVFQISVISIRSLLRAPLDGCISVHLERC